MLFGQKSGLPGYYHRIPGNINDVSTLHNLLETFRMLEIGQLHYVMDKGFYSKKNVDDLVGYRDHFTISVPINNRWLQRKGIAGSMTKSCMCTHASTRGEKHGDGATCICTTTPPNGHGRSTRSMSRCSGIGRSLNPANRSLPTRRRMRISLP